MKCLSILFVIFSAGCTVEHKLEPIKVEKIEVDHKVTPIIVKLPWGKDLFKADSKCQYIDQISKANLGSFCSEIQKNYKYNCCEIDFSELKESCVLEFCVEKYYPDKGCVKIIKGCI